MKCFNSQMADMILNDFIANFATLPLNNNHLRMFLSKQLLR